VTREYPPRPIVGVGGVVVVDGRVLLIKRRFEPLAGRWSIPGGAVETGETMREALAREVREETALDVEVGPVLGVFDRITRDAEGRARYHFVLVDFLCRRLAGDPAAASDVSEIAMAGPDELARYDLTPETISVIQEGLRPWPPSAPHGGAG